MFAGASNEMFSDYTITDVSLNPKYKLYAKVQFLWMGLQCCPNRTELCILLYYRYIIHIQLSVTNTIPRLTPYIPYYMRRHIKKGKTVNAIKY